MAFVELPALNCTCDNVGNRGEERNLILGKFARLGCVGSEHPVGSPIVPGDGSGEAAHHAVIIEKRLPTESGFRLQIFHDDRAAGCERVSCL